MKMRFGYGMGSAADGRVTTDLFKKIGEAKAKKN